MQELLEDPTFAVIVVVSFYVIVVGGALLFMRFAHKCDEEIAKMVGKPKAKGTKTGDKPTDRQSE